MLYRCRPLFILLIFFISTICHAITLEEYIKTNCKTQCVSSDDLLSVVKITSENHYVDYKVILAIIKTESSFKPKALNGKSVGLMQVNLIYHKDKFGFNNPYNIFGNVFAGTTVLRNCMDKHKNNLDKSFRCYNGNGDPMYVSKVRKALTDIKTINFEGT